MEDKQTEIKIILGSDESVTLLWLGTAFLLLVFLLCVNVADQTGPDA